MVGLWASKPKKQSPAAPPPPLQTSHLSHIRKQQIPRTRARTHTPTLTLRASSIVPQSFLQSPGNTARRGPERRAVARRQHGPSTASSPDTAGLAVPVPAARPPLQRRTRIVTATLVLPNLPHVPPQRFLATASGGRQLALGNSGLPHAWQPAGAAAGIRVRV